MEAAGRQPWWAEYFDEHFVALYGPLLPPELTREEVTGVTEALGLPPGARILDLACGWGRHSLELARLGYRVTGLDRSPTLLELARRSALEEGLAVEWVRGDMRELPFAGAFDAVVSLFSSLGYFLSDEEDARVLRAARTALRPGGVLLLEGMHRDHVVREFVERDWWEGPEGERVWVEREFDVVAGVSREWLRWEHGGQRGEKHHAIRVRTATEWARLLEETGFVSVQWYGDWDGSPLSFASERLIALARG